MYDVPLVIAYKITTPTKSFKKSLRAKKLDPAPALEAVAFEAGGSSQMYVFLLLGLSPITAGFNVTEFPVRG